jgi:3-deoxy-D-manno-octulosonic-acid transferase
VFARALLEDAYRSMQRVGAIDQKDGERLHEQGVRRERISVTGDTRYDQVWSRAQRPLTPFVQSLRSARPTLVAGSTWPSDEEHLLPAWSRIRDKIPDARLVIAPHEISRQHLKLIEDWARTHALRLARIDADDAPEADVILVDRYGILGDLYALADVAYVGGGFQSAGLHSVLEPAAFGVPVLFGPRHEKSRDAVRLIEAGGGAAVTREADLSLRLSDWLGSLPARDVAGAAARALVQSELGAAERSFALVSALLAR